MVYGRPQMLHPSTTRSFIRNLPSKTDEEILGLPENPIDSQGPRKMDFFVESLKLIHHLGDILELLSGRDSNISATHGHEEDSGDHQRNFGKRQFQKMLSLDTVLVNWQKDLPSHLRPQYRESSTTSSRHVQVLRARYESRKS
jgi:hypothetical protein